MGLYSFRSDFPREFGKDDYEDEEDGVVKDIEEPFGKSTSKYRKPEATAGAHRLIGNHGCKAINKNVTKRLHKCARATLDSGCISFLE